MRLCKYNCEARVPVIIYVNDVYSCSFYNFRGAGDAGSLGAGSGDFCESFEDYGEIDADRSGFGIGGTTEKWARNSFVRSSIRG